MSGSYAPRNVGLGEWKDHWDDYNDVPDGGLAEEPAAQALWNIRKKLVADGLSVFYVDNNNQQISYVVTWPELAALAHGQNPSDPLINAAQGWVMANDNGQPFPFFLHPNASRNPVKPRIEVGEARGYLNQGRRYWDRPGSPVHVVLANIQRAVASRGGR